MAKAKKSTISRVETKVSSDKEKKMYRSKGRDSSSVRETTTVSFRITRDGKQKEYRVPGGYGYLIPSVQKARNMDQVRALLERGLPSKEIRKVVKYLNLKVPEIAKAAAVSPSTVSRWKPESTIGVQGSSQFLKIDYIIKKGVELFGDLKLFRAWLSLPNVALGNDIPANLLTSLIGLELVDEALDALRYGNVM